MALALALLLLAICNPACCAVYHVAQTDNAADTNPGSEDAPGDELARRGDGPAPGRGGLPEGRNRVARKTTTAVETSNRLRGTLQRSEPDRSRVRCTTNMPISSLH